MNAQGTRLWFLPPGGADALRARGGTRGGGRIHTRPSGRAPRGKRWDELAGAWVDDDRSPASKQRARAAQAGGAGAGAGAGAAAKKKKKKAKASAAPLPAVKVGDTVECQWAKDGGGDGRFYTATVTAVHEERGPIDAVFGDGVEVERSVHYHIPKLSLSEQFRAMANRGRRQVASDDESDGDYDGGDDPFSCDYCFQTRFASEARHSI